MGGKGRCCGGSPIHCHTFRRRCLTTYSTFTTYSAQVPLEQTSQRNLSDAPTNRAKQREWRELGFYYDRDDEQKVWKLVGSRKGLSCFTHALREYVADPRNNKISEHEHYGPYSYLEVMTWPEAGFDGHAIRGPIEDLLWLAELIDVKLNTARPGSYIVIRDEFGSHSPYSLILAVQEDGFDPAEADPQLRVEGGS